VEKKPISPSFPQKVERSKVFQFFTFSPQFLHLLPGRKPFDRFGTSGVQEVKTLPHLVFETAFSQLLHF
jgi:hypothetical protein